MTQVTKSTLIHGPLERVFDLVTTAQYWPQWHPATLGVSGAIEQPMKLGDTITEKAKIGGVAGEGDWRVVEHQRPNRVVLRVPNTNFGDVQIAYRFAARGGDVEFTRMLEFDLTKLPPGVPSGLVEKQMDSDSEIALQRLKALVERLIAEGK